MRVGRRMHGERRLLIVHVGLREGLAGDPRICQAMLPAEKLLLIADADDDECLMNIHPLADLRAVPVPGEELRQGMTGLYGALAAGEVAPGEDEEPLWRPLLRVSH